MRPIIRVVIPAWNEADNIGLVVRNIPVKWCDEVVVVDNHSTDETAERAEAAGATVLHQPERGYGAACLKGIEYIFEHHPQTEIIAFLDGDFADTPAELPQVLAPILAGQADLVIGSRALGKREKGSMTVPQRFGNWLATRLLKLFYGVRFTDLGPFRAIKTSSLILLNMRDRNFGWTVEMQIKAAKNRIRCAEVPVSYQRRHFGNSKVSGTLRGTIMAGYKILYTIFRYL